MAPPIHLEPFRINHQIGLGQPSGCRDGSASWPAQEGLTPRHQFAWTERLDQVVIGSLPETLNAIGFRPESGEHYHIHIRMSPDGRQYLVAGPVGQQEIQHHNIDRVFVQGLKAGVAVGGGRHGPSHSQTIGRNQPTYRVIVFNDQQRRHKSLLFFEATGTDILTLFTIAYARHHSKTAVPSSALHRPFIKTRHRLGQLGALKEALN